MSNECLVTIAAASITTAVLKDFLNYMPNLIRNLILGTGIDLCHDFNPEEVGCLNGEVVVVVQSLGRVRLCSPTDCSTPGFPVLRYLPEFAPTHVHWVGDAVQSSHPVTPFSSCPQSFPESGSFPVNCLCGSGGQSIGASASASVLSMNIQGWFPLGLTGLILQSKGL